jgi:hypothetical protein
MYVSERVGGHPSSRRLSRIQSLGTIHKCFGLVSIVFQVIWAIKRGFEGGIRDAAYIFALATLFIGFCAAYLE